MDARQFAALYEPIYKDLYRFALYTMGNVADAEDAVSESVLAAWENREQLRNAGAFKSWIFQITANTCKKHLKIASRMQPVETDDLEPENPPNQLNTADAAAIKELFDKLDGENRLIVALSVFSGYKSKEIGSMLSMNANTVRSRRKRALDWMAAQWKGAK